MAIPVRLRHLPGSYAVGIYLKCGSIALAGSAIENVARRRNREFPRVPLLAQLQA